MGKTGWNIIRQLQYFPWSCVACAAAPTAVTAAVRVTVPNYGRGGPSNSFQRSRFLPLDPGKINPPSLAALDGTDVTGRGIWDKKHAHVQDRIIEGQMMQRGGRAVV